MVDLLNHFPWQDFLFFFKSNAFIFTIGGGLFAASTWLLDRAIGRRKMAQLRHEQQIQSDQHILDLCKALSDSKQTLQLAAAALLVDRARTTDQRGRPRSERIAILQALLAATIDDKRSTELMPASTDLCKFIADNIVVIQAAKNSSKLQESPLNGFYLQQVRLPNADWKDVDARNLDFFGANFEFASLRRAKLHGAVLNNTCLRSAVLCGADLREADLRRADLSGADLRPCTQTGIAIPTMIGGAKLHGADLTNSQVDGVDFSRVSYDSQTKWPQGAQPPALQDRTS